MPWVEGMRFGYRFTTNNRPEINNNSISHHFWRTCITKFPTWLLKEILWKTNLIDLTKEVCTLFHQCFQIGGFLKICSEFCIHGFTFITQLWYLGWSMQVQHCLLCIELGLHPANNFAYVNLNESYSNRSYIHVMILHVCVPALHTFTYFGCIHLISIPPLSLWYFLRLPINPSGRLKWRWTPEWLVWRPERMFGEVIE